MQTSGKGMLDNLSEDEKEQLCDLGAHGRLVDVVLALKQKNINASAATVCRFLRRHREQRMLAEAEEMKGAVDTFARRAQEDTLRKGTIEAVRQRLYEQALSSSNTESMTKLYETLLKEETRLKELELEARRTAVAEENLKLQRQRLQIDAFKTALKDVPEALRILCDENLDDKIKVNEARRCLSQWNERAAIASADPRQIEPPILAAPK